jgi:hypothetical protein
VDIFIEWMNTQTHKALPVGHRERGSPRREDVAEVMGGGGGSEVFRARRIASNTYRGDETLEEEEKKKTKNRKVLFTESIEIEGDVQLEVNKLDSLVF